MNKNVKLKIRLETWGRTLLMQILEQDERFTWDGTGEPKGFKAFNGFSVESQIEPEIKHQYREIYLRGRKKERNDLVCKEVFASESLAIVAKTEILQTLNEWSKNAPEFKEREELAPDPGGNVYVF